MPKFIMLCGLAGSGKSRIAGLLRDNNTTVLSSDDIRAEMWGSAEDQQNPGAVFTEMNKRTVAALQEGHNVIYDATNLSSKRRAGLLRDLTRRISGLETELCIVVATPEQCIANQNTRDRKVPDDVILKMVKQFQLPTVNEGWDSVYLYNGFYREGMLDEMLEATVGVSQLSKWHQETVDKHQDMVAQYAASHGFSDIVVETAKIHDIGKPLCRFVDEDGETHFYGHANAGAWLYLCTLPSQKLEGRALETAMLIEHHMDIMTGSNDRVLIEKVGQDMTDKLHELHEADEAGAILRDNLAKMSVLDFMNTFDDWEDRIQKPPFCVTVKHDNGLVLLKYQQLNSDMSIRLVQECRGSIFKKVDGEWKYVCRPFDKFFNYGEGNAAEVDWKTARVLEKVDGSLTKLWHDGHEWRLSTNGTINAFTAQISDSGLTFGEVFNRALGYDYRKLAESLDPAYTYMFELTSPDTQLVIPYEDGVWYLSRRHTESGKEEFDRLNLPGVKLPKEYKMARFEDVIAVAQAMSKDEEGFVVNDADSHRVKVKSPEYLIASHLANNKMVSNRNIVMYMQNGTLDDFLAYCPQYAERVSGIVKRFDDKCQVYAELWDKVKQYKDCDKKTFAAIANQAGPLKHYLFAKLKNPDLTPSEYLLGKYTAALMRELGLKDDKYSEKGEPIRETPGDEAPGEDEESR